MIIAVKTRIDPIDRSMLRDTMIMTIPVVMIATAADWTDRFHRLRGDRKPPSDMKLKAIQMMARAPIMPINRVSTSGRGRVDGADLFAGAPVTVGCWIVASDIPMPQ